LPFASKRQDLTPTYFLHGENLPFESRDPIVRVKSSSLPLCVAPPQQAGGVWNVVRQDADGISMEYRIGKVLAGFALSGKSISLAAEMERAMQQPAVKLAANG
jgi:hypothetical protein